MSSPHFSAPSATTASPDTATLSTAQFALSGMRCAACAQIIEYRLRQLPGVEQVDILYAANRAEVKWQPQQLSLQAIIDSVVALGYRAMPLAKDGSDTEKQQNKTLWWRIFIAGFAMMQVMMYAFPAWMEPVPSIDGDLTPDIDRLLKLASFCLSVPVFFFSAWPFYQGVWRSLKQRQLGMDVPVSIGIIATFVASSWATFAGGAVYYDSLVMFVFLLLLARMVEAKVQQKSAQALRELTNLVPPQALLCRHYPASVDAETVLASSLQVGDVVLLQPGSAVPVDGVVLEGIGECDEALMTGEAQAVLKEPGAQVIAGAINLSGRLLVRAEQVGEATQISHLVAMMARASAQKPAILQVADRHASWFLAAILALSIASGVVWSFIDLARALPIALTVLVITCPCALSLATPAVMAAVIGQLAKRGVLGLLEVGEKDSCYEPAPDYPEVKRDIAFLVDKKVSHEDIINVIQSVDVLIKKIELFDVYEGEKIEAGKKSVAYHLFLRHLERTFTSAEVEATREKVKKILRDKFNAEIRE
ncbi:MAG: HAD-IC family P-type ATPase [Burkholderiales bacterium]|nr:HAD-IC family P-type ATPase [Burkholderiales bacterium]